MTVRNTPRKYKPMYDRAMSGKSRKAAMRMFCLECVGYSEGEVALCTDTYCPLFPYRPKSKAGPPKNRVVQRQQMAL